VPIVLGRKQLGITVAKFHSCRAGIGCSGLMEFAFLRQLIDLIQICGGKGVKQCHLRQAEWQGPCGVDDEEEEATGPIMVVGLPGR